MSPDLHRRGAGPSSRGRVTRRPPIVADAMTRPGHPQRKPRTIDPRLVAPLAFVLAAVALALVIVYSIGGFVERTIQAVPVG